MTVIKINAVTVPAESGDELARRFAACAGALGSALRPACARQRADELWH